MKKFTSTLMLIMLFAGMIHAQSLTSAARGDKAVKSPYPQNVSPDKVITGSITCQTPNYIPGSTQTLNFTFTFASPDTEYADGISLTFPAGMTPQTVGTSNPLSTLISTCPGVNIDLNPITGQTVIWGQITAYSDCGALLPGTYPFQVSVVMGAGLTGTQTINYFAMGDGWGAPPNEFSGTITLSPAQATDVGVASIPMASNYMPASTVAPSAIVQNFGTTAQTFDVSMVINDGTTNIYTQTLNVANLAAGATQTVTFPNWTAVLGSYTATVTTVLAGDANTANDVLTKSFTVANITPAYTGIPADITYHSISLADGSLVSVGAISDTPFPMSETYNGTSIYRVYNDFSYGTVDPTTGVYTQLGTMTGVAGTPTGLAWNPTTYTMYVLVLNAGNLPQLCTLNMSSHQLTLIGTGTEGMIIGMDFANDGNLYGPSLNPDNLYRINPANGAVQLVGALGVDLNFGQDVSFDQATQKLYTVTCGAAYKFGFYDLTTGAFNEIADMNGKQHATFVVMNQAGPADDDDVMVESIVAIPSGCSLSATQSIEVVVKNVGNVSQSNIPVTYTINGGTAVTGTVAGPLAAGASVNYTFTTTADFSAPGIYAIEACTNLSGDSNPANDCKTLNVTSSTPSAIPYSMGFEPTEDYTNWVVQNLNSDPSKWEFIDYVDLAHSGTWLAIYEYNATMNANDWLITTCINLNAGVTYDLSFWAVIGEFDGTVYPEKMKVAYGTAPTSTALTNVIVDLPNMNNVAYEQTNAQFTVPTTGIYYFGFHAYSDMDMFYIALDDILIEVYDDTSIPTNINTNVKVYPNPTKDFVQVVSDENISNIEIYTYTGQLVYTTQVEGTQFRYDASTLSNGLYMIKVITDNGTSTHQIMISK